MEIWLSLLFVIGFVVIHLTSRLMKFLDAQPRSRFLSIAGGVSVAYVFMHLLPELEAYQKELEDEIGFLSFLESHIYIIALLGFAVFYGLEQWARSSKNRNKNSGPGKVYANVFWIHMTIFSLYNATIGYLLIREEYDSEWDGLLYFIAMGIHFVTIDKGLRATHRKDYDRYGRWMLAVSITIGWMTGVITELNLLVISVLTAFLAGGIILNVMKEELPEERESSFLAFFLGMAGYAILLLFM